MDLRRRMEILSEAALDDREHGLPGPRRPVAVAGHSRASVGIAAARLPGGGSTNLMGGLKPAITSRGPNAARPVIS